MSTEQRTSKQKLYAVGQRECWKLGDHYTRNSLAMTAEGLHKKSDIAAELGVRDAEIERLRVEVERLRPMAESWESYEAAQERKAAVTSVETSDALTVPLKVYDALKVDRDDWRQREHALRAALQKIVDEGDYTAPEGMKRIAQDALISAEEPERYHGIGCATHRGGVCNCAADVAQPENGN